MSMMRSILLVLFCATAVTSLVAQQTISPREYADRYAEMAVRKMHEYGIPASITLAQGILESGSGNSELARQANNHFGIKCHSDWTGDGFYMDDDAADECFRVYASVEESYADHSIFLSSRARYKFLFTDYERTDYEGWAGGLKRAGYATNPRYPQLLIDLIERLQLDAYDTAPYPGGEGRPVLVAGTDADTVDDRPEGVFQFNRTDAVVYRGETLGQLAARHDVDADRLKKYNDLYMGEPLTEGMNVYLQPKRRRGSRKVHVVREGESVWEISQMEGVRLTKLMKRNRLDPGEEVRPGELLYLRKKAPTKPATITWREVEDADRRIEEAREPAEPVVVRTEPKTPPPPTDPVVPEPEPEIPRTHTVQPGETLYRISMNYYLTVEELKALNGLTSNTISVGQVLLLRE